ncbi:unnamed protein product [Allacma fusca]|uniref:Uncharacterized protein n=1 Tax=Allacma fusca TaxID=39272 RepID=A0A8J2JNU5_9HEXA|nr:unnamed protein product [Allacma fusca]
MVRVTAFPKTSSMYYRKKKKNLTPAGILKGRKNRRTFSTSLPILHEDVQDIQEDCCQIVPINESTDNISCSNMSTLLDQLPSTSGEARLKSV